MIAIAKKASKGKNGRQGEMGEKIGPQVSCSGGCASMTQIGTLFADCLSLCLCVSNQSWNLPDMFGIEIADWIILSERKHDVMT